MPDRPTDRPPESSDKPSGDATPRIDRAPTRATQGKLSERVADKVASRVTQEISKKRPLEPAERERIVAEILDRMPEVLEPIIRMTTIQAVEEAMADELPKGIVQSLRVLLKEDYESPDGRSLLNDVWRSGYDTLLSTSLDHASKWIGKKILVAAAAAGFVYGITMLVKYGLLK